MSNNKRKAISLEEKYEIIKEIESKGKTQQQVSDETWVARGTIARWCTQDMVKITEAYEFKVMSSTRKRIRFSKY